MKTINFFMKPLVISIVSFLLVSVIVIVTFISVQDDDNLMQEDNKFALGIALGLILIVSILVYILSEHRQRLILKNEEKYRFLTENSKDAIWMMDFRTFRYTYISEACYAISGFTPAEYLNMTAKDVLSYDSYSIFMHRMVSDLNKFHMGDSTAPEVIIELQQYHKDGSLIWVETSAKMMLNRRGILTTIIGITRPIEERKELELELKQSEEKYRMIAENSEDAIWTMDLQTLRFTFMSDACRYITGYSPLESINMTANESFSSESLDVVLHFIAENSKHHTSDKNANDANINDNNSPQTTFEALQHHKDGSLVWVEISAKIVANEYGNLQHIVGSTRRIDDRKIAELQILQQKEELQKQKEELHLQKEELQKLNAAKDKFLSIIAHDLRNPFMVLLNLSQILKEDYERLKYDDTLKYINLIYDASNHTFKLLNDLLEWARSSTNAIKYAPIEENIHLLLETTARYFQGTLNIKDIAIEIKNNVEIPYAFFDGYMIETIVRNLIANALKFSNAGSCIHISVDEYAKQSDYLLISIKDSGIGMPLEQVNKLFKIDEKSISTKGTNNEAGTGLGLILCKEFIDRHNCEIWAESKMKEGTTFFFTLPKAQLDYN